jgi:hypothetical protein
MKKASIILLAISVFALFGYGCDGGSSGGGSVCTDNVSVSNTSDAKLYYPCNISSPTGATTMTSGYTGTLSQVEWLSERVAGAGFVVLAFTPSNIMGMVGGWRDAHKSSIAKLKDLNNSHATLRGKIATNKLQTCGHSKGGGGSLWASSELGSQLATTIGMAPWQEQFSDSQLRSITAATLVQAGSGDTLATGSMTKGEYNSLGNIKKAYFEYSGASHMAWASASGSTATELSEDIIAWMKFYMNGDTSAASTLNNSSGQSEHIWVDPASNGGGSSSSGGCN